MREASAAARSSVTGWRQSGAMQAIQTEAQYAFIRDRVRDWQAGGYQVELLTMREARTIEPEINPALLGAMYTPLRGQADPKMATRAFAAAAAVGAPAASRLRLRSLPRLPICPVAATIASLGYDVSHPPRRAVRALVLCKLCSSSPRPKEPSALCAAFTEMPSGCGVHGVRAY